MGATAIFEAIDVGHTDDIPYSEFLAAMVSSRIALHDDLLKESFRRFDTDNSGFITMNNLRQVLGASFQGEEVEKLMREVDESHDGKISYEEWIKYLRGGHGGIKDSHTNSAHKFI